MISCSNVRSLVTNERNWSDNRIMKGVAIPKFRISTGARTAIAVCVVENYMEATNTNHVIIVAQLCEKCREWVTPLEVVGGNRHTHSYSQ